MEIFSFFKRKIVEPIFCKYSIQMNILFILFPVRSVDSHVLGGLKCKKFATSYTHIEI
jgi:hypothetical protein